VPEINVSGSYSESGCLGSCLSTQSNQNADLLCFTDGKNTPILSKINNLIVHITKVTASRLSGV